MIINALPRNLLLTSLILLNTSVQAKTISVYGAEQGQGLTRSQQADNEYLIQMGSFKNKQYATELRDRLARKTNQTVHLVHHADASVPYAVFLGPFNNVEQVNQVSRELLGEGKPVSLTSPLVLKPEPVIKDSIRSPRKTFGSNRTKTGIKNNTPSLESDGSHPGFVTFNFGPGWSDAGKTQTFSVQPDIQSTYVKTNNTRAVAVGEIFAGYEHAIYPEYKGQLGFAVQGASNLDLTGDVWVDSDPNFNNMFYTYSINHLAFALKGKLISEHDTKRLLSLHPYVSGSVGLGFNQSHKFGLTPKIFEQVVPPLFKSHTVTAFTYTVGAGLQKRINPDWIFGLGYDFADWGKSNLAAATGQTIGRGLALNHVYVSELQFGFTFQPQARV
ncbi:MAG: SPOR domain-containing protein [Legionellaceae bacterium]|nr:SPOR domain-containing protein [Legionellaceae bacterium]